jgi:alpha-tubulin suppressor-like RCC1 family protein
MIRSTAALSFLLLAFAPPVSAQVNRWGAFGKQGEQTAPGAVSGIEEEVVKIDAGNASAYALTADGAVLAWGSNGQGQLGDRTRESSFDQAVKVHFPAGVKIVAIGEERASGFAVDRTGHAWAWGEDAHGSGCLGGYPGGLTKPHEIPDFAGVAAVQGGGTHSIWLMQDGAVMMCGLNDDGQLGQGYSGGIASSPVQVPGLSNVVEVSAGQDVSCARTASGAVYDWGDDGQGQVGNGVFGWTVSSPYLVPLPQPARQISCGGNLPRNGSTLVVLEDGEVYGWGADLRGQLGDSQTEDKASPVPASVTAGLGLTQVVASGEYSLGLGPGGDVYAWGFNERHALGVEHVRTSLTPLLVGTGAVEISATAYDSSSRE